MEGRARELSEMTAGNGRALWWRPHTRAAWRVQQRALSQARQGRRMDSTGARPGCAKQQMPGWDQQGLLLLLLLEVRTGREGKARKRTTKRTNEKEVRDERRGWGGASDRSTAARRSRPDEPVRRDNLTGLAGANSCHCMLLLQLAHPSGEVRWPGIWRAVRSLQPTRADQMRGWGREGSGGKGWEAGESFGTAR